MKHITTAVLALAVLAFSTAAFGYAAKAPNFTQADPRGVKHSLKLPLLILWTAPILSDKGSQTNSESALERMMPNKSANFYVAEDMSVSDFKGIARHDMKKDWKGPPPMLLIDDTGGTRKAFGVATKENGVLVYDKSGKLVYSSGACGTNAGAKAAWAKYK